MNDTINTQLNHRTIRAFTDEPVTEETLATLFAVANRTASSTGMQHYSIIRITDPAVREALFSVSKQEYIKQVPELLVFVVDCYRNSRIAREKGVHLAAERDMDRFFQGFTDGVLAAQNLTVAAESMGLGCVYFGSLLNDAGKTAAILKLPELTFPIFGLGLGHPDQSPQLKPRMPLHMKVFENAYATKAPYLDALADYDEEMQTYYDLRDANRRVDSFTQQVVTRLKAADPVRSGLVKVMVDQGFDLGLD